MNFFDIVLILLIALMVFLAVRSLYLDRKRGKACGGCSGCAGCGRKDGCAACRDSISKEKTPA